MLCDRIFCARDAPRPDRWRVLLAGNLKFPLREQEEYSKSNSQIPNHKARFTIQNKKGKKEDRALALYSHLEPQRRRAILNLYIV